jgi:hypothetical protein
VVGVAVAARVSSIPDKALTRKPASGVSTHDVGVHEPRTTG